ncbi:ABC transporter permease [Aureibaculum sp. A20]|uniref:ABC transporter permease n=1 Tax=Aureibaculum flavum TaxID=2795986 RepID=A0ABS0WPN4_9FLAO|nr:ABC transporter permease [Aureibaculum flavum]MBJ2173886.1 ABC transporter permease [Aureibaculum flavum]
MKTIFTVIKKELTDTLRDRKTLISAILLPALAMPLIILGVTKLQKNLMDKEQNKQLKVALIGAPENIVSQFNDSTFLVVDDVVLAGVNDSIENGSIDALLEFDTNFNEKISTLSSGGLKLYYKSTNLLVEKRIREKLDNYTAIIMNDRIKKLNISSETLEPLSISKIDIASPKEQIGKLIGGFIPYIFIILCFTGCMYPALDLITGEKERGTLETLLTVPASRFKILIGKTITIALVGIAAAIMAIAGMFLSLKFIDDIPQDFLNVINDLLGLKFILMLFAMLIPLSIFFAGLLSAIVVRASSFKEAQSYVTPLSFVIIIPAMIALMPGVELTWQTAWIPILNIALATKEIIAGTIQSSQYLVVVGSLILLAIMAVFFSLKQFSKETMVLK